MMAEFGMNSSKLPSPDLCFAEVLTITSLPTGKPTTVLLAHLPSAFDSGPDISSFILGFLISTMRDSLCIKFQGAFKNMIS